MINIGYPYSAHICTRSSFANFETVYHYRDWCTTNNPKYEFWQKLRNLKNLLPTLGATSSSTLHITKYQDQRDHISGLAINSRSQLWIWKKILKSSLPALGATSSSSTLHISKYQYQRDHLVGQSTILAGATLPPTQWKDPNLIPTFAGEFR